MSGPASSAARYDLAASTDWQVLLKHFELGQGFAFIVLLVEGDDGPEVCRAALERHLKALGQRLMVIPVASASDLENLAETMLTAEPELSAGAVWVARAVSEGDRASSEWRQAWRAGVMRLNQFRNPFRRHWPVPVIFVGAPWLQEVLRDNAPDLWSIRQFVSCVAPHIAEGSSFLPLRPSSPPSRGPDPEMAMEEAARLRLKAGAEPALARVLHRAGLGFSARSQWQEAIHAFRESLETRRLTGAPAEDIADTCYQLASALRWTTQYEEAVSLCQEARQLYRQAGAPLGEANCIQTLGDVALATSDNEEARRRYEEALPLYREAGDVLGEANCIQRLGDIALRTSDLGQARRRYEEALPLYRQVASALGEANSIKGLGDIALRRSDHGEARRRYEEALPLYRQAGDVLGEANCIQRLGDIALDRSDLGEARRQYEEALPLFRQVGGVLGEANSIERLGNIALREADLGEARRRCEEALPLFRQVGDVLGQANCIKSLGDIAFRGASHDEACRRYEEALPLYRQVGSVLGEANSIRSLGDIALKDGMPEAAREYLERALSLYQRIEEPYSIGQTHRRLARLADSPEERDRHVEEAREAWGGIDRPDLIQQLYTEFGAPAETQGPPAQSDILEA